MVSFWLDTRMGDIPLCQAYPVLFELAINKKCSVSEVKENGWVIQFKVRLQGLIRAQWYDLANKLNRFPLNNDNNVALWKWSVSKTFTVKSVE
jgi:hypothetical protein